MVVYVLCIYPCPAGKAWKGGVNLAKIAADESYASGNMTYFRHNELHDPGYKYSPNSIRYRYIGS
jgi:hypothetical protein